MLRGEIVALNQYCLLEGKTKGTRLTPYYLTQKKLLSLLNYITTIQVVSKKSYKEE